MKTKGMLLAAGLLVVLLVGAAAQAQNGLVLRYRYAPGDVQTYLMKGTVQGAVKTADASEMPVTADMDGRITAKTTAVSDRGVASQEITLGRLTVTTEAMGIQSQAVIEAGKITVTVNGQPVELPQGIPGVAAFGTPIKAKVDPRGRVLQMDTTPLGDLAAGFDPSMLRETSVVFPEGPVNVGDSWSSKMTIPLNMMGRKTNVTLDFTYTFAGVEQYKGKDVARLDLKGTATMASAGDSAFQSRQTFSGFELFDYSAGRDAYDKINLQQTMTMPSAAGQPAATMTMTGDFEVTIE